METWQTIFLAFGGNAALLAVLGVIGKSLLDKLIVRDTKHFEADLKAKSDSAIEHLKNELQLKTIEHQVRFSRLHEKRADVIAELYGFFVEALWEAESFLSQFEWNGEPNKKEKHITAMNKLAELYRYFDKHRIYLPVELCSSLEQLVIEVRALVINFGVYVDFHEDSLNDSIQQEKREAWNAGWKAIKNQVPLARQSLENEFRSLLGAAANPAVNADAAR
ncbi:MAG: hypothetical protein ACXWE9_05665 [Methylobacter sp.]